MLATPFVYKVVLYRSVDKPFYERYSEQFFHAVLFTMLCKVVLTFTSVDETPVCDHLNESYWAVLSCGTVNYAVQGGSITFKVVEVCGHSNESYWAVLSCGTEDYVKQVGFTFKGLCISAVVIGLYLTKCDLRYFSQQTALIGRPMFEVKWDYG